MTLEYLQNYWWLIISVLGAVLVFMLFVQGGQSMLFELKSDSQRDKLIECIGRKWELTFTVLVVFGGAAFASFPLFYAVSFGGAYWLWILILFSFVIQAVSYEYRKKSGNLYGTRTYDTFLLINGIVGCILLGVAVAMFFFGANFTLSKGNLINPSDPYISQWVSTHGLEAVFNWKNLVLGVAVFFLARTLAALYMMNYMDTDKDFFVELRQKVLFNGGIFVVFFLGFLALLLTATGYESTLDSNGNPIIIPVKFKYWHNYLSMWWCALVLLVGVSGVLYGILRSVLAPNYKEGIWPAGIGVILVVASLFWVAGYNNTSYYPSLIEMQSSLTIRNSSSSLFTLQCMSWVSIIIPFVAAYIWYVWRAMDKKRS